MNTKLNKSDWLLLTLTYVVTIIFNSIDYYQRGYDLIEYVADFSSSIITSISVILLFMYWLIPNYILKQKSYFLFILFGVLILMVAGLADFTIGFWSGNNDWSKFPPLLKLIPNTIFSTANEAGFTFGILLAKKFYEGRATFFKVQQEKKENELKLLRSQIDPHFLFNNLNTLDSLIDTNSEKAKEYINRLSLIYRYLIQTKDAEVMELSDEIQLAENYIFLIKTRFGNDYDFSIEKEAEITDKFVPTGAIQGLLENVVKHNKPSHKPIKTAIIITEKWLKIINSKSDIVVKKESFGTGLQNLKTRYQLLSDQEISVINTENEFKVTIPIIQLSNEI